MVQNLLKIVDTASADLLERRQFPPIFTDTARAYPRSRCVHDLFETQAECNPEAIAVVTMDREFTYQEINARANQLARFLKRFGVGPGSLVGLCVERSPGLTVSILGIFKAGAGYVELNPTYRQDRLSVMMQDANIFVLLTQAHLLDSLPQHNGPRLCLDSEWDIIAKERADNCEDFAVRADWTPHWKRAALRARRKTGSL